MKKRTFQILSLLGAAAMLSTAQAALRDYDPFEYTGTALAGQDRKTGFLDPWFTTSPSQPNSLSGDGVSLSYPVPFQSPLTTPASYGSRVKTGGLAAIASTSRMLSQSIPLNVDGAVAYASALFRKNQLNGGGTNSDNILLEFVDSAGNRRWGFGIEGSGDKPWVNLNSSTNAGGGPAVIPGETYLIVTKIVPAAAAVAGADKAYLKVFGPGYATEFPATEPTTWDAEIANNTAAVLDRIRIRIDQGNMADTPGEVDDIRIGSSWADMAAVLLPVVDTEKPVVVSASSLLSNVVNVIFSEPVDQTSAESTGNYTLAGNTISVATLLAKTNVQLTVDTPISANYTLSVANVQDPSGNVVATTNVAGIAHLGWNGLMTVAITNGMAYAMDDDVIIYSDGADIFNTANDHFQSVYRAINGDFDVSVRVESLLRTANSARAGIMARLNPWFDSANVLITATPDRFIFQYRTNSAEATLPTAPALRPPTSFPNSWIRLKREGAVFSGYSSTNYGVWHLIDRFDTSVANAESQYPAEIPVGLVASANHAAYTTRAQFSDFDTTPYIVPPSPTLSVSVAGNDVEVSWPEASKGYTLKKTTSLLSPLWTDVTGSKETNRVFVPMTSSTMFFRAIWESNP